MDILLPLNINQTKTLKYIIKKIKELKYPPNYKEIQNGLGFSNPGKVHRILNSLEQKGYLIKEKNRHRGIRLTDKSIIYFQKKKNEKFIL